MNKSHWQNRAFLFAIFSTLASGCAIASLPSTSQELLIVLNPTNHDSRCGRSAFKGDRQESELGKISLVLVRGHTEFLADAGYCVFDEQLAVRELTKEESVNPNGQILLHVDLAKWHETKAQFQDSVHCFDLHLCADLKPGQLTCSDSDGSRRGYAHIFDLHHFYPSLSGPSDMGEACLLGELVESAAKVG